MKDNLKQRIEQIIYIHLDSKYYYRDYKYLCQPDTKEEREVINNSFISRIRTMFWKMAVIELNKLFQKSSNEHFNLIHILESLIEKYDTDIWIQEIDRSILLKWLNKLNNPDFTSIKSKLKKQRDEYIAHTDKNPSIPLKEIIITFEEFETLILFTEEIVKTLQEYYFNTLLDLNVPEMEKAGNILEIIYKHRFIMQQETAEEWNKYLKTRNKNT